MNSWLLLRNFFRYRVITSIDAHGNPGYDQSKDNVLNIGDSCPKLRISKGLKKAVKCISCISQPKSTYITTITKIQEHFNHWPWIKCCVLVQGLDQKTNKCFIMGLLTCKFCKINKCKWTAYNYRCLDQTCYCLSE